MSDLKINNPQSPAQYERAAMPVNFSLQLTWQIRIVKIISRL